MNRYAFAGGNPISFVELDGHRYIVADGVYAHSITGKIVEDRSSSTANGSGAGASGSAGVVNVFSAIWDFLSGASDRTINNLTLGAVSLEDFYEEPNSMAYDLGAVMGDLFSMYLGTTEMAVGGGEAVVTVGSGVLSWASPLGAAFVFHGAGVNVSATRNFSSDLESLIMRFSGGGAKGSQTSKYVPNKYGYFGVKGESSSSKVRNMTGGNKAALEFWNEKTQGYVREIKPDPGVTIRIMPDGQRFIYRPTSSSDGTPVVEIHGKGYFKPQKIHFVP